MNDRLIQVLAPIALALAAVCPANESAIPTIKENKELDALIKETVMQGKKHFSFRLGNKQSIRTFFANSQWYDYACGYCYRVKGTHYSFDLTLKDSTRMLLGHMNPEFRNRLNSKELEALNRLEARLDKLIKPGMSERDKTRAIHDDLVNRVTYKRSSGGECTAMLLKDSGVCEAYARYMFLALNIVGVDCHIVYGRAGGAHAWNLAKIDGHWYHIDATWDDPICKLSNTPILRHDYFCISDKAIARNHKWNTKVYPAAPEMDDIYFRRQHRYFTQYAVFWRAVRAAYEAGEPTFEAKLTPLAKQGRFADSLKKFCKENPDVHVEGFTPSESDPTIVFLTFASKDAPIKTTQPTEQKVTRPEEDDSKAPDWMDADTWKNLSNDFDSDKLLEEGSRLLEEGVDKGKELLDEGADRLKRIREGASEWWD